MMKQYQVHVHSHHGPQQALSLCNMRLPTEKMTFISILQPTKQGSTHISSPHGTCGLRHFVLKLQEVGAVVRLLLSCRDTLHRPHNKQLGVSEKRDRESERGVYVRAGECDEIGQE